LSISGISREREISIRSSPEVCLYNRFLNYVNSNKNNEENEKAKYFKTNIMKNNEFTKCDICGERIKIEELSLYNATYNLGGHFDHIVNFINAIQLQRIYNK